MGEAQQFCAADLVADHEELCAYAQEDDEDDASPPPSPARPPSISTRSSFDGDDSNSVPSRVCVLTFA